MKKFFLFLLISASLQTANAQDNSDKKAVMQALKEKWEGRKVQPAYELETDSLRQVNFDVDITKNGTTIHIYFFPAKYENTSVQTYFYVSQYGLKQGGTITAEFKEDNTVFLKGFFYPYVVKTDKIKEFTGKVQLRAATHGTFLIFATNKTLKFGQQISK